MTKLVNLRHTAKYDIYIGRAGRGYDGTFGNPIAVGRFCPECGERHQEGGDTLACYRVYLERRIQEDPPFRERVKGLLGKRLACFCVPEYPCHGRILIEWVDKLNQL